MSQSVNLVLKSTQILADNATITYFGSTIDNAIGTVAKNRTSLMWKNINMRTLLGDMYDKHDRFNINLNFIAGAATGANADTTPDNRMFQVKLSGLPFTSPSNNQPTVSNTGTGCLTTVQVPLTASTTWYNNALSQQSFTFLKQDFVNIQIDLQTILTDTYYSPANAATMIGHTLFSFSIYGVDNFENKDTTIHRFDLHPPNKN